MRPWLLVALFAVLFAGVAFGEGTTIANTGPLTCKSTGCTVRNDPGGETLVWSFTADDDGEAETISPFVYGWVRSIGMAPSGTADPFGGETTGSIYLVSPYLNQAMRGSSGFTVTDNTGVGVVEYYLITSSLYCACPLYMTVSGVDAGVAGLLTVVLEK